MKLKKEISRPSLVNSGSAVRILVKLVVVEEVEAESFQISPRPGRGHEFPKIFLH